MQIKVDGFLLTRQWLETADGQSLVFWLATDRGPVRCELPGQSSVFFVENEAWNSASSKDLPIQHTAELPLLSFAGEPITACYFKNQRDMNISRARLQQQGVQVFESDIRPTDRFLMERFVTASVELYTDMVQDRGSYSECVDPKVRPGDYKPSLSVMSVDIETSYTENRLYSIGAISGHTRRVFMVAEEHLGVQGAVGDLHAGELDLLPSEAAVIQAFLHWCANEDPDVLVGWNVVGFDLRFLQNRCDELGLKFTLGRDSLPVHWREAGTSNRTYALVPGRVVLDGIEILRTATYSFESFSLESVSRSLLGRGKLIDDVDARGAEIQDLYRDNKLQLAAYNLEDCQLVLDIFAITDLLDFAMERARLTGLEMDRAGGSVAAFDYLYLPRLHRAGYIAPLVDTEQAGGAPGGFVLESDPGLYEHVVVLDFKSLYPSIIRTFHVDPLAMIKAAGESDVIPGFEGASFSKEHFLLPVIIEELWAARDEAKRDDRTAMSQAIKIIMNSFYGVLGTPGCRFFDKRLVSSITRRGHEILQQTRDLIEARGFKVIYGDTDSVFVLIGSGEVDNIAAELVEYLNGWWHGHLRDTYDIPCCLELEYESHFDRFLMPRVRGSEKGSKKRYAGLKRTPGDSGDSTLVFKGLESVRSDWTKLAREFQTELYRRIFVNEPVEDFVKETVTAVVDGAMDDKLVLRKRLRRKLEQYQKSIPPHVIAARKAELIREQRGLPPLFNDGGWVEYYMTVNGPEPRQYRESAIDYQFYVDKQLTPVANAILVFQDSSLELITDRQLDLF